MTSSLRRTRVCFTALNAYPLFDARSKASVGGMETRAYTLARGLAAHQEYDVQFVVQAPWWFRSRHVEGITAWNTGAGFDYLRRDVAEDVDRLDRVPFIRIRRFRPSLIWRLPLLGVLRAFRGRPRHPFWPAPIYQHIRADVQCCFGVSAPSATAIASALAAEQPSLLWLASNSDLDERYAVDAGYINPNGVNSSAALFCLRKATLVVAQHETQRRLLRERFDRDGAVLPGVIDLAEWDAAAGASIAVPALAGPDRYVLWVGRADDFHKRPALCLELARRLRNLPFLMILNRANAIIERSIYEQKPASVTILESVPFEQMPVVMSRAAALVSTSAAEYEGAPNVFLQAAASRIPIVSLEASTPMLDAVSPDCVAGGNLERLGDTLVALWHDSERSRQLGSALRRYVEQHHALPVVIEQLRDLLRRVTAAAARV